MMASAGEVGSMGTSVRTIPAMGRPFRLGMLYDCCREQLIPNRTLWKDVLIEEHTKQRPQAGSQVKIIENATLHGKASAIGMDPSLKLSFSAGSIEVDGSGKYLEDSKLNTNTACVTVHHVNTVDTRELDISELENIPVAQSAVDETQATHVVTGILYGSQCFLVLNTEYEKHGGESKAIGKVKEYANRLTKEELDEEGNVMDRNVVDQAELDRIQCSYYGDKMSDERLVSYETMVHTYRNVMQQNVGTTADAKPIKVWLYPLCKLNLKMSCDIHEISSKLTNEIQDIMEQLQYYEMQSQDLTKAKYNTYFPAIVNNLQLFANTVCDFRKKLSKQLAVAIPSARRSKVAESDLANLIRIKEESPFSNVALKNWLEDKKKEIRLLEVYLKLMLDIEQLKDTTDLDCLSVENDCLICLVVTFDRFEDHTIDDMTTFLKEGRLGADIKRSQEQCTDGIVQQPWFHNRGVQQSITAKVKSFNQFYRGNMDNGNIKFVAMFHHTRDGTSGDKETGAHITVIKNMNIQYEDFQVPSEPGQPKEMKTTSDSITLEWDKPTQGYEYIDHYDVKYREVPEKDWHEMSTDGATENITIHGLKAEDSYHFQVRAACIDGVANFGKISKAFTTFNPPSCPGPAHVVNVEGNSILIEWSKPEYRAELVERYEIQYKPLNDNTWKTKPTDNGNCSASLQDLTPGSPFEVRVRAWNAQGVGLFGEVTQLTFPSKPPSAAGKPVVTGATGDNIDIEWTRPEYRHEDIHHYEVEYRVAGQETWASVETEKAVLHTTITGLRAQTNYECRVRAICQKGNGTFGPISDAIATKQILLDPPCAPGAPIAVNVTAHCISLTWYRPRDDHGLITRYEIRFKERANQEWGVHESMGLQEEATFDNLQENTLHEFRVRTICDTDRCKETFGPFGETEAIKTDSTFGLKIKRRSQACNEVTIPRKYKVPLSSRICNRKMKTRKCHFGKPEATCTGKRERTIMLVGATGSGKSTMIDGMINYIANIRFEDEFRLTLVDLMEEEKNKKSQADSQTDWITLYTIHQMEGSRLDFTLNIIDTPGFADTRGIERDQQLVDQIQAFFSNRGDDGVQSLDGVCFVTQAPLARLNHAQRYIYDSIQALFGKDIASNIFVLITFADGNRPPVLDALKEAQVPDSKCYKFNNSALFTDNTAAEENPFASMFWKLGKNSFDKFFKALELTPSRSLTLTNEVLTERESLEAVIQGLNPRIRQGLNKLDTLRQELRVLKQHKAEIAGNKNFKYTVTDCKQIKVDLKTGSYVTNCLTCNCTCHYPCAYSNDADKVHCAAMCGQNCGVCPGKCHWTKHVNNTYRFELIEEKVERTYANLKKRYETAEGQAGQTVSVIDGIVGDFMDLQESIRRMIDSARKSINRLSEIALKPNPLTTVGYIDMMIEGERHQGKPGHIERIKMLNKLKEAAELVRDIQHQDFNPWTDMIKDLLEEPMEVKSPKNESETRMWTKFRNKTREYFHL